jgi:hypothetical protein
MMMKQYTNTNAAVSPLPRTLSPEEACKVGGGGYMLTPGGNLVYTDPSLSSPIVIKIPHPTAT